MKEVKRLLLKAWYLYKWNYKKKHYQCNCSPHVWYVYKQPNCPWCDKKITVTKINRHLRCFKILHEIAKEQYKLYGFTKWQGI